VLPTSAPVSPPQSERGRDELMSITQRILLGFGGFIFVNLCALYACWIVGVPLFQNSEQAAMIIFMGMVCSVTAFAVIIVATEPKDSR